MSLSFDFDHIILMSLYSFHCVNRFWELFRGTGELDRKGWGGGGGLRVFKDSNYVFYITSFIWLTIYVQTGWRFITYYSLQWFLAYLLLLIVFLIVFYFLNSSFNRKKVQRLTQVFTKIFINRFFYFTLLLECG